MRRWIGFWSEYGGRGKMSWLRSTKRSLSSLGMWCGTVSGMLWTTYRLRLRNFYWRVRYSQYNVWLGHTAKNIWNNFIIILSRAESAICCRFRLIVKKEILYHKSHLYTCCLLSSFSKAFAQMNFCSQRINITMRQSLWRESPFQTNEVTRSERNPSHESFSWIGLSMERCSQCWFYMNL